MSNVTLQHFLLVFLLISRPGFTIHIMDYIFYDFLLPREAGAQQEWRRDKNFLYGIKNLGGLGFFFPQNTRNLKKNFCREKGGV